MRNLTGVLVFSTTLLLGAGCHKNTGESSGPADASSFPPGAQTDASPPAPPEEAPAATPDAAAPPLAEAAPVEPRPTSPPPTPDKGAQEPPGKNTGSPDAAATAGTKKDKDAGVDAATLESCVDRWLKKKNLDAYGHPEGTMYAGGTPLFDERTGESTDRLTYVFNQHPEVRKACMAPPRHR
ncbi:hypothetical protein LY474_21115 [Myxococcus stipitatus]|uniref:hypothetical protein n=1 Tax=Myxococcus stipitatus TaxID=83455 RepID=UPI001F2B9E7A|nr:hypothetical protein [Myxococcus stipitatus]MCE9670303.1 hypothetical protein [Myxococcus stipitatus]